MTIRTKALMAAVAASALAIGGAFVTAGMIEAVRMLGGSLAPVDLVVIVTAVSLTFVGTGLLLEELHRRGKRVLLPVVLIAAGQAVALLPASVAPHFHWLGWVSDPVVALLIAVPAVWFLVQKLT